MKKFIIAAGVCAMTILPFSNALAANPIPKGVGVNIHFTGAPTKDLDLIKNAGFNMARTDLKWDVVERTKGQYNWTEYDQLVNGLLSRGITPYLILDYNNPIYGAGAMDGIRGSTQIQGFTNFAKAAAAHYKGKKIIFEIWNEPNLGSIFWRPTENVTDYMNLVKSVSPAMKAADPNCVVVAPGVAFIANTFDYLKQCLQQGLLNYVDGLSVHPYKNENPEDGTVDYLYTELRNILGQYGKRDFPILGGEFGFSTTWSNVRNETNQAQFLVRQLIMHDYYNVPVSIVYDFRNDGTDPNNAEHNFGILRNDYSQKPAYTAIKAMRSALAGYTYSKKLSSGSSDYIYEYTNSSGKMAAAWTTGGSHSATIYGKTVTLTNMPTFVKDSTTTNPPSPPPSTDTPTTTGAPVINKVSLGVQKTKGEYSALINWKDNATNETGIDVYQSIGNESSFKLLTTIPAVSGSGTTTTSTVTIGISPTFGTYYYKLVARLSDGSTKTSNVVPLEVKEYIPANPDKLSGSNVLDMKDNKYVILNWNNRSPNEDGFNIYYTSGTSSEFSKIGSVDKDRTSVLQSIATPGTYRYMVTAYNEAGESTSSPVVTVTIN